MENGILFIGDSLTEWFDFGKYFPGLPVRNEGIAGDTSFGVLERIEEIPLGGCSKIFLMVGINDVFNGFDEEDIVENIELIIENLQTYASRATLVVQSLLPVNEQMIGYPNRLNNTVVTINERIREHCEARKLTFLDLHGSFLEGREMNTALTTDGAHLSESGYSLWAEKIKAFLS